MCYVYSKQHQEVNSISCYEHLVYITCIAEISLQRDGTWFGTAVQKHLSANLSMCKVNHATDTEVTSCLSMTGTAGSSEF